MDLIMFHPVVQSYSPGSIHPLLTGQQTRRGRDGRWVYPPLAEAMEEAVLQEVETYISRLDNTVAQFIVTRLGMDLCLSSEMRLVSRVEKRWWSQDGLDGLVGGTDGGGGER